MKATFFSTLLLILSNMLNARPFEKTFVGSRASTSQMFEFHTFTRNAKRMKTKTIDDKQVLYAADRKEWREWLNRNFETEKDIWLALPKKASAAGRIVYSDAVEEALCFGWIDSHKKNLDEAHSIQRFSPRKPKSGYSQLNRERLRGLAAEGLIHSSVHETVQNILAEPFVYPPDILAELQKDPKIWANFEGFPEAYRRIRVASVDLVRNEPENFRKRLDNLLEKTRQNRMIVIGGNVEKYY